MYAFLSFRCPAVPRLVRQLSPLGTKCLRRDSLRTLSPVGDSKVGEKILPKERVKETNPDNSISPFYVLFVKS